MKQHEDLEILLIESDLDAVEAIAFPLQSTGRMNLRHSASLSDVLEDLTAARFDVIIADGKEGLAIAGRAAQQARCPVMITASEPTVEHALTAIRSGVADIIVHPFSDADLIGSVTRVAEQHRKQRRRRAKTRRLRRVASRIISERQELRQQMDLICCDIVQAYRRLAEEVSRAGILDKHETS